MTTQQEKVQILIEVLGAQGTQDAFKRVSAGLQKLKDVTAAANTDFNVTKKVLKAANVEAGIATQKSKAFRGQLMGIGFSALFASMALKQFAMNTLKSLFATYTMITENQTAVGKQLLGLQAAFEFLKFSIIETFGNSEIFRNMISNLIEMTNGISRFVANHPMLAKIIVIFLAMAVVIGTIIAPLGQIALLAVSIGLGFLPTLGIVLTIITAITIMISIFTSDMPIIIKLTLAWATIIGTALTVLLSLGKGQLVIKVLGAAFSWLAANPIIILIAALVAVITALYFMQKRMGGVGNFFKSVIQGMINLLAILGNAIVNMLIGPLETAIDLMRRAMTFFGMDTSGINKVLNSISKIKGTLENAMQKSVLTASQVFGTEQRIEEWDAKDVWGNMKTPEQKELTITNFDEQIASTNAILNEAKTQNETLGNLTTSSRNIEDLIRQKDQYAKDIASAEKKTTSVTQNITISANEIGRDVLDKETLRELLKDIINESKRDIGTPNGG